MRRHVIDVKSPLTLNDLIGVVPGLSLLFGFALASLLESRLPETVVTIDQSDAAYRHVMLTIPESHEEGRPIQRYMPYAVDVPELDSTGTPILRATRVVVAGRGKSFISVQQHEILLPEI